jgi:integrase
MWRPGGFHSWRTRARCVDMATPSRGRSSPEGIVPRHRQRCTSRQGAACNCRPAYQAQVWSPRDQKTLRRTFGTLAEARAWRAEAKSALRLGTMRAPTRTTLSEAAEDWLSAAKAGIVRTRSGETYKPSAIRAYEQVLRARVLPAVGHLRLSSLSRNVIQDLVDRLVAEGLSPSSVRNTVLPLRAIYRRAVSRSEVLVNPTLGLALPASRERRARIARPAEAKALIEALSSPDRALWATALYAGLRRGELQALRWSDIDFSEGVIRVERGWDERVGPLAPKSRAGRRRVPLTGPLRSYLAGHRLQARAHADELVFGRGQEHAFSPEALVRRARAAWEGARQSPIGLHECRHTYAAYMVAAGVNAKALSTYMGHSSITVTLDRYGHLMPGNEREAAGMLAEYLRREVASG